MKTQIFKIAYKVLHNLSDFIFYNSLSHPALTYWPPRLLCGHTMQAPSEPLHFPFPQIATGLALSLPSGLYSKITFSARPSLTTLTTYCKTAAPYPHWHSSPSDIPGFWLIAYLSPKCKLQKRAICVCFVHWWYPQYLEQRSINICWINKGRPLFSGMKI